MLTVSGPSWLKFWNDSKYWGDKACEDERIFADGKEWDCSITEAKIVRIESGLVFDDEYKGEQSLISFYKAWEKKQKKTIVCVEIEKNNLEELKSIIKQIKGAKICAK